MQPLCQKSEVWKKHTPAFTKLPVQGEKETDGYRNMSGGGYGYGTDYGSGIGVVIFLEE